LIHPYMPMRNQNATRFLFNVERCETEILETQ
jgi:hypothetical protein